MCVTVTAESNCGGNRSRLCGNVKEIVHGVLKKRKENRSRKLMLLYMVKIVNLVKMNDVKIVFIVTCTVYRLYSLV